MYQNHQSSGKRLADIEIGIRGRVEGAYVKVLVHLVDELVLGIGE